MSVSIGNLSGSGVGLESPIRRFGAETPKEQLQTAAANGHDGELEKGTGDWVLREYANLIDKIALLTARHAADIRQKNRDLMETGNPNGRSKGDLERVVDDEIVGRSGSGDMALGPKSLLVGDARAAQISESQGAQKIAMKDLLLQRQMVKG